MKTLLSIVLTITFIFQASGHGNDTIPSSISLDTISIPQPQHDDDLMITFYQQYSSKSKVKIHFVSNSAPLSSGDKWKSIYGEGNLNWNDYNLEGEIEVLYDSDTKAIGSLLSEVLKDKSHKVKILLNTKNGKVEIKEENNVFIYQTEIKNNIIYGFNNSNKIVVITFENS